MAHHPSPLDNDLIRRALRFAEIAHRGEKRKGTESPYFVHPVAVATLLAHVRAPDTMIAAGFLHDVVEDTDVTVAELRGEFGPEVAEIVGDLSKPDSKQAAAETYAQLTTLGAAVVKAADLTINCTDIFADAAAHGPDHLRSLFRDPVAKLGSYLDLAQLLFVRLHSSGDYPYAQELAQHLLEVERQGRRLLEELADDD